MTLLSWTAGWLLFAAEAPPGELWKSLLPFVVVGVLFYLIMLRPESRKRKELEQRLEGLNMNDHVVTVGGIYGVIVNAAKGEPWITIRVDDKNNTRLRIRRSAVSQVVTDDPASQNSGATLGN